MNKKKILVIALVGTLMLSVCLCIVLGLRRNIFGINDYIGRTQPDAPVAEEAAPGEAAGSAEKDVPPGEDAPSSAEESKDSTPVSQRPPSVSIALGEDSITPVTEFTPEGIENVRDITLPEGALDWGKPMKEPQQGDIIEIAVYPGREYRFEVELVDIYENPRKIVVLGSLVQERGQASMTLLDGKMLLQIQDFDRERLFNLYFSAADNKYKLQEINMQRTVRDNGLPPGFNLQ